ncbi:MAG: hypothetical protein ACKODM_04635, partial [Cytophagales bacterium]
DEQRAKENWKGEPNPYASLPRMVMMTYQLPDSIREIAMKGEFNEFDLNVFFSAEGEGTLPGRTLVRSMIFKLRILRPLNRLSEIKLWYCLSNLK